MDKIEKWLVRNFFDKKMKISQNNFYVQFLAKLYKMTTVMSHNLCETIDDFWKSNPHRL